MINTCLVLIGRKLTEDLLFWERLGRALKPSSETPTVLLHGPGETTERTLEGDGFSLAETGSEPGKDAAIRSAFRSENRRSVALLTDAGIPAVGFLGTDRRLIEVSKGGAAPQGSGPLRVRTDLISNTAATGTVPLLGCACDHEGALVLPSIARIAAAWLEAEPSASIRWLMPRSPRGPVSLTELEKLTGEDLAGNPPYDSGLSVRVTGISEVGSRSPDAGQPLVF